ncbi:MAG: recombination protein RecR [Bacteroidaceae bacterium]|nr:recombination protein RecR [Bacteroidaceae bacterium]
MTDTYPSQLLERAVSEIAKLPGIGRKTALRLSLHLLRQDSAAVRALADSLTGLRDGVKRCHVCHNLSDTDTCGICADPRRDASTVCVVETVSGVLSIENTGQYRGLYHVLGGVISPMDGIGPADLEIQSLVERVEAGGVREVIFALSPTMEGDTTGFYISRRLAGADVLLTTLARGISVGDDLEYTDEATLGRALAARVKMG